MAKRLVEELIAKEKKEAEEKKLEEEQAEREAADQPNINKNDQAAQGFTANGDKSWYFYNAMTKSQGKTEFQRRWGARKLEDDWRRKNKASFSMNDENEDTASGQSEEDNQDNNGQSGKEGEENVADASDPHNPEYYLSQIPNTPEQKQTANDVIQEGLYNMALILKDIGLSCCPYRIS